MCLIYIGLQVEGIFYNNLNTNIFSELNGTCFESLRFLSCNVNVLTTRDVGRILHIFFMVAKFSINLKCCLLDLLFAHTLQKEDLDKALHLVNKKEVWKKLKNLNVLQLKNYIFIKEFLHLFFEIAILL